MQLFAVLKVGKENLGVSSSVDEFFLHFDLNLKIFTKSDIL